MEIIKYRKKATEYFTKGHNCAQSVLAAFSGITGISFEQSLSLASSFGGGMGRMGEVCGALTGMFMVAGLVFGYTSPADLTAKSVHYKKIEEMGNFFKSKNGSILCRDLLEMSRIQNSHLSNGSNTEKYPQKPCLDLVGQAAEMIAIELKERNII